MSERPHDPAHDPDRDAEGRDEEADAAAEAVRAPTPVTQQLGRVVVLVLVVIFIVFALSNSQPVDFSWVFGDTEVAQDATGETTGGVPLIVLLLASFVIGALSGAMLMRILKRRRARAAAERDR